MSSPPFKTYRVASAYGQGYPGTQGVSRLRVSVHGDQGDFIATVVGLREIEDIFGTGNTEEDARKDLQVALRGALAHLKERAAVLSPRLQVQLECLKEVLGPDEIVALRGAAPTSTSLGPRLLIDSVSNFRIEQYAH